MPEHGRSLLHQLCHFPPRGAMRLKLAKVCFAVAVVAALGACTDASEPAGPSQPLQVSGGAGQDPQAARFAKASPAVLALPGTVFADHDETSNQLVFGVENA